MSEFPKWLKEMSSLVGSFNQFFVYGNVRDYYIYHESKNGDLKVRHEDLDNIIVKMLQEKGRYTVALKLFPHNTTARILYKKDAEKVDRLLTEKGYQLLSSKGSKETNVVKFSKVERITSPQSYSQVISDQVDFIKNLIEFNNPEFGNIALIYDFSSRHKSIYTEDLDNLFYLNIFEIGNGLQKVFYKETKEKFYNLLIWTYDKDGEFPIWYFNNNHFSKSLLIPYPDLKTKGEFLREMLTTLFSEKIQGMNQSEVDNLIDVFSSISTNLYLKDLENIMTLAEKRKLNLEEIEELIKFYKLGIEDSPWKRLNKEKIATAEQKLSKDVLGQDAAVKKSSEVIKRAFFNLSGVQFARNSMRPKGVLFFAGPTGVGKTELAKSIAKLIFGTPDSYIRFDMSEFSKEQSDQRLLGAPPGYVGYEEGGELINKIKENPFTVVLFDEIEKAHQKILDIFLQILDEGRITSSRGETVYFSESIIIFTSNLGVYREVNGKKEMIITPDQDYESIKKVIKNEIKQHFIGIGRPEILNRIGENIVVLDFIRPDNGKKIVEKMLKNVLEKLRRDFKIDFIISENAREKLYDYCLSDLSMGGRGIGNKLEEVLINPLSEELFRHSDAKKITLKDIVQDGDFYNLSLEADDA
ncbi:MAG TPA: AAA family ATPase [Fervidobacterium sp.]|nr:AAA family ATPase [Fervidobacterium sp.]HQO04878.1 AAA family ATPase [Fervidobacterium sp.]HQQ17257.1 AAA family ATPase [Fervidobacterium sp.]